MRFESDGSVTGSGFTAIWSFEDDDSGGGRRFDICGDSSQHPSAGEVGILFDGTEGDGYINGQASSPFFPMQSMRAACSPWLWCINN